MQVCSSFLTRPKDPDSVVALFVDGVKGGSKAPELLTFATLRHFISRRWPSSCGILIKYVESPDAWDMLHVAWRASGTASKGPRVATKVDNLECGGLATTWTSKSQSDSKPRGHKGPQFRATPKFIVPHLTSILEQVVQHTESIGTLNSRHRPLVGVSFVAKLDASSRVWLLYADGMELRQKPEVALPLEVSDPSVESLTVIAQDIAASLSLQCRCLALPGSLEENGVL